MVNPALAAAWDLHPPCPRHAQMGVDEEQQLEDVEPPPKVGNSCPVRLGKAGCELASPEEARPS